MDKFDEWLAECPISFFTKSDNDDLIILTFNVGELEEKE